LRERAGKLDGSGLEVAADGCDRVRGAALGHHVTRTTLAAAALGGHAEFELNLVESHAGTRMPRDLAIGNSATHADDHGGQQMAGWLGCGDYK